MHLSHFASAQNVAHGRPTPTTPKTSCGGSLSTPQASVDGCRALTSFVAPGVPPWKEFLPANLSRPPLQGRVSTTPLTPSAAIASNKSSNASTGLEPRSAVNVVAPSTVKGSERKWTTPKADRPSPSSSSRNHLKNHCANGSQSTTSTGPTNLITRHSHWNGCIATLSPFGHTKRNGLNCRMPPDSTDTLSVESSLETTTRSSRTGSPRTPSRTALPSAPRRATSDKTRTPCRSPTSAAADSMRPA